MKSLSEINLRDPFIIKDDVNQTYLLFGTNFPEGIANLEPNFAFFESKDLKNWSEAKIAFQPDSDFWGVRNFWAPEVHHVDEDYYLVGSFKGAINTKRASLILRSETQRPQGPFKPVSNLPITPTHLDCLDATLYQDSDALWLVYCVEWTNNGMGRIDAVQLSSDLSGVYDEPVTLIDMSKEKLFRVFRDERVGLSGYLTDAPFLFNYEGQLYMIWSSYSDPELDLSGKYTINLNKALDNKVNGTWSPTEIVLDEDIGHPSVFESFDGQLYICAHINDTIHGQEHPIVLPISTIIKS